MALDQSGKPIPGIPLAALDAIENPAIRSVLRALVDTHNVRNNLAGSGADAFITTRQAMEAAKVVATSLQATAQRPLPVCATGQGAAALTPGSLSGPIATLHLDLDSAMRYQVLVVWVAGVFGAVGIRAEVRDENGKVLLTQVDNGLNGYAYSHIAVGEALLEAGSHSITLHFGNTGLGTWSVNQWGIYLIPVAA